MKKFIILPFLLLSTVIFAQQDQFIASEPALPEMAIKPAFPQLKNDYIALDTKVLTYEVIVRQDNKDIFKSSFDVKNGKDFVFFTREIGKQQRELNQKAAAVNRQEVIRAMELEEKEAGNIEQVTIVSNIGKDKNIFSEFSWKTINMRNLKKTASINQQANATATEVNPLMDNNQSSVMVIHKNNNEASFTIEQKEFIIKAIY